MLIPVDSVLSNMRQQFDIVNDYRVELQVTLHTPRLRMPRKRMTLYFKRPDKVRLESTGFAMLPRRGLVLSPDSLFKELQDLAFASDTLIDGRPCVVLVGYQSPAKQADTPVSASDRPGHSTTVSIDRELWLIREITSKQDGQEVFRLSIRYAEVAPGMHLPEETTLRFNLDERHLRTPGMRRSRRSAALADTTAGTPPIAEAADMLNPLREVDSFSGSALITFSNYRVNMGIPDQFFEEVEQP